MRSAILRIARAVSLGVVTVACTVSPSYDGTEYLCGEDQSCPDGFECVVGRCVVPSSNVPSELSFSDDGLDEQFGDGTFSNAEWDGDELRVVDGEVEGTFVSRVFDAEADVTWSTLQWLPSGPYAKPLPDMAQVEAGYPTGNADMTDNVLLLHLEPPDAVTEGVALADTSGRANDAIAVTPNALNVVPGQLGKGIDVIGGNHLSVQTAPGHDLEFGTSDFTWALWMRTVEDCTGNKVYLGTDDRATGGTHIWLGCTPDTSSRCPEGDPGGRAGGHFTSDQGSDEGEGYCGSTVISDGEWHHVAIVKSGHAVSTLELYVDGHLDDVRTMSFSQPLSLPNSPLFTIGTFPVPPGQYDSVGTIDEVSIWRRALTAEEVAGLHTRASMGLELQVRACSEPDCSDAPTFVGPTGPDSVFADPTTSLSPPDAVSLTELPTRRYFQYRIVMRGSAAASPGVRSVRITATRAAPAAN